MNRDGERERKKTRSNIDKLACSHNDAVTTQESSRVKTAAATRAARSTNPSNRRNEKKATRK